MTVFSSFYRNRIPILILSLWLIVVFLLGDRPVHSQLMAPSTWVKPMLGLVSKKTINKSVTEKVRSYVLENGLTVITKEVHTAPVVTVQVWYKVGSGDEEVGVNGIAHQLEHMMFKGTQKRPIQFGRLYSALGSDSNAFTSYDQTAYYGTAERQKLKSLLELEADRMENSLIDAGELESEKKVVISELQGYENSPEYRLNRAVMRAAFPNHPYGLPVGGTAADVEKFTPEQVQAYYRKYYSPDNAVLVIVGDFNSAETQTTVEEIFGKIAKKVRSEELRVRNKINQTPNSSLSTPNSSLSTPNSSLSTPNSSPIILKEPGAAALLQVVYPLPDISHPDVPALDVLDYILTEGRNSRLYRALVDSGLASEVDGSVANLVACGWYELLVTADTDQDLRKLESVIEKNITQLKQKGVTQEEVDRAKRQLEAAIVLGNRDITAQGMQLANDQIVTGDFTYIDRFLAGVRRVTPQDVVEVAKKYLKKEAPTIGYFEPTEEPQVKPSQDHFKSTHTTEHFSPSRPVDADEAAKYLPSYDDINAVSTSRPLPEEITLSNGLQVLLLPDKSTPTVTLSGYIKAGSEFDPENKAGLASLVAENLMNGTKTKDALAIAKILDDKGAHLSFDTYREGTFIDGSSLAADLPVMLSTLTDVLKNPIFENKELELSRQHTITALKQDLDDPSEVARRTFVQSVYPKKHPLHNFPTEKSLRSIRRQDLIDFKEKHYRSDTILLALVGDFDPKQVRATLENHFENWYGNGEAPVLQYPAVSMPESVVRLNPILPGKAQAITYMGYTAIQRNDPRYYAALILNQIVGGDTLSSRLGAELRDKQGLTYGIYSNFLAGKNTGHFYIEMQTSPEDTSNAIASTRKLLGQINQQGVSPQEVELAKRNLISNYIVSLVNPDELAHRILMNQVYGLDKEELRTCIEKIQAISLNEVNQAARELLHPDKIIVVTAGPPVLAHPGVGVK